MLAHACCGKAVMCAWTWLYLHGRPWTRAQLCGRAWTGVDMGSAVWIVVDTGSAVWTGMAGSDTGSAVSTRVQLCGWSRKVLPAAGLTGCTDETTSQKAHPESSHMRCAGRAQDHAPPCDVPHLRACHPLIKDRLHALPERICSSRDSVCPPTPRAGRASDDAVLSRAHLRYRRDKRLLRLLGSFWVLSIPKIPFSICY